LKKGKNQTYQTTDQFPYFLFQNIWETRFQQIM
jgi:hypothetical protein